MGTGISMFAEVRCAPDLSMSGMVQENPEHDAPLGGWRMVTEDELLAAGFTRCKYTGEVEIYQGQNYDLFAILADVRGYCGGEPIDEPRGLPVDVSDEVAADVREYDYGHSWFTVRELLDHDWGQGIHHEFIMTAGDFVEWGGEGDPGDRWERWDDESADGVVVEPAEYESMIKHGMFTPGTRYFVRVRWVETHAMLAPHFYNDVIPRLRNIGPPEETRIVFWFDS